MPFPPLLANEKKNLYALHSPNPPARFRGITNIGNTCFMNAPLQCLSVVGSIRPAILAAALRSAIVDPSSGSRVLVTLGTVLAVMGKSCGFSQLRNFHAALVAWAPQFAGNGEHDAQEFLGALFDALHAELHGNFAPNPAVPDGTLSGAVRSFLDKRGDSLIARTFGFFFRNTLTCNGCTLPRSTYEYASVVTVQITAGDLDTCLEDFLKQELLDVPSKCPWCGESTRPHKQLAFATLPPCLVVMLKRYDHSVLGTTKNSRAVTTPLSLSLHGVSYRLTGRVDHEGPSFVGGHYVAWVDRGAGTWVRYSDLDGTGGSPPLESPSAYICVYETRDLEEEDSFQAREVHLD